MSEHTYDNTNTARLFVNKTKEKPTHPDERGSMDIEGIDMWLSCWVRTSESGVEYRSLQASPKDDPPGMRRNFAGVMFKVREPSSERAPTWEGHLELNNGQKVSLSAWERVSAAGDPWVSISISEYKEKPKQRRVIPGMDKALGAKPTPLTAPAPDEPKPKQVEMPAAGDFDDDDCPF